MGDRQLAAKAMAAVILLLLQLASVAAFPLNLWNTMPEDIHLFWEPGNGGQRREVGVIAKNGGTHLETTHVGHTFSYDDTKGQRHQILVCEDQPFVRLDDGGPSDGSVLELENSQGEVRVRCSTTVMDNESFDILVRPSWSPKGAARFLELVREGYYDGCGLTRVVPNFLTQLGIGANAEARTTWRLPEKRIPDDPSPWGVPFKEGMLSFAGSGKDSRATDIFIVMPDATPGTLRNFGTNPWETPFGMVDTSAVPLKEIMVRYGDMPPWGKGPNPGLIYPANGYEYLRKQFPKLDYLGKCAVVDDNAMTGEFVAYYVGSLKSYNNRTGYGFLFTFCRAQSFDVFKMWPVPFASLTGMALVQDFVLRQQIGVIDTYETQVLIIVVVSHSLAAARPQAAPAALAPAAGSTEASGGYATAQPPVAPDSASGAARTPDSPSKELTIEEQELNEPRRLGTLKSFSPSQGYGFISCDEIQQAYQRDVYLDKSQLPTATSWRFGQCLEFAVSFNARGHPQARRVNWEPVPLTAVSDPSSSTIPSWQRNYSMQTVEKLKRLLRP
ncbi:unnamed protein product, partial [Polarella glacialis]